MNSKNYLVALLLFVACANAMNEVNGEINGSLPIIVDEQEVTIGDNGIFYDEEYTADTYDYDESDEFEIDYYNYNDKDANADIYDDTIYVDDINS